MKITTFRYKRPVLLAFTLLSALAVSGCVSDTLNSTNTSPLPEPIKASHTQDVNYDPVQREAAIAEIRQKAANANSGQLTNAYAAADGPNEPQSPDEAAAKIQALQQIAGQEEAGSIDPELAAKQLQIKQLQQKARTHYGNALQTIEN